MFAAAFTCSGPVSDIPVRAKEPALMGLLAGFPTIIGSVIGSLFYSDLAGALFFSTAAGALLYARASSIIAAFVLTVSGGVILY